MSRVFNKLRKNDFALAPKCHGACWQWHATMEGIVPSRCRLRTWHLGTTLFKLRLHQICKSHVTASMHHGTWGLMQSHFFSIYWRPDSSHCNEPTLGGYQLLLSKIQGTQASVHYIERSTTQLVEYKALNLVDVGSSPMVEIILYDVIINKLYTKSQLSIILLSRPLGATRYCSNLHHHIYKVPAHYCIMTRPLGATLVEVFMSIKQLQVPGCCKHDNPTLGGYNMCGIFSLYDRDE